MQPVIEKVAITSLDLTLAEIRIISPHRISKVKQSKGLHGQLHPIIVRPFEDHYQVIDGLKRVYAAMELGLPVLECYILEVDLQQAKLLVLSYNRQHRSMEVWGEAMVLGDLQKHHHLNQRELSKLTGYSRCWVSRRLSLINKIDPAVVSEIKMGTLLSSQARALIKLPRGNQNEVVRVILAQKLSSRQCELLVKAFLNASDQASQQHLLKHPEDVLYPRPLQCLPDERLSSSGNQLQELLQKLLLHIGLLREHQHKGLLSSLRANDKMLLEPQLSSAKTHAGYLLEALSYLQPEKAMSHEG